MKEEGETSQPQEDADEASQPREKDEKPAETSFPLITTCLLVLCVTGLLMALKLS
jgi:hypothetical protein